jgi:hypothetical protein
MIEQQQYRVSERGSRSIGVEQRKWQCCNAGSSYYCNNLHCSSVFGVVSAALVAVEPNVTECIGLLYKVFERTLSRMQYKVFDQQNQLSVIVELLPTS